jgi:hypothetical protein
MRDVPLVPECDVLEADQRVGADEPREPADALGDDGVPLVRHRRRSLLAPTERFFHLAHLGPGKVSDLEREPVERRREDGEGGEELGMPVALEDLRRARGGLEPESLARDSLHLGRRRRVRPHGA